MLKILRTLFFFVVFWLYQLLVLPVLGYIVWLSRRGHRAKTRALASRVARHWAKTLVRVAGLNVGVEDRSGLLDGEAALFVSNHQGAFDIPILSAHVGRPLGFVAKKELEKVPLLSTWMRFMGCVFLDRGDRRKQIAQIRETVETLKSGHSMVIFPEGTRSNSSTVAPFAKGSLNIAEKAGVRIVPVSISGSYKVKQGNSPWIRSATVEVTLHPALRPGEDTSEREDLADRVRNTIVSAVRA